MGQTPANKRKQPDSKSTPRVSDFEQVLYDLIKSKQDMGIKKWEMTREANLPNDVVTKCLKSLIAKKLIREVENFRNKGKRHNIYMAAEFKPSTEVTGGSWYVNGNLDTEFIQALKDLCLKYVYRIKVATTEVITESIRRSGIINVECSTQKIAEMLQVLVLDNEIMEVRSTEMGEFASIPLGTVCYKCSAGRRRPEGVSKRGGMMVSIPCGVCPRLSECTPNGTVSPSNCIYFTKWLDF